MDGSTSVKKQKCIQQSSKLKHCTNFDALEVCYASGNLTLSSQRLDFLAMYSNCMMILMIFSAFVTRCKNK